jgi:hypothetical protein
VKQGFITPEAARKFYGYNLEAEPAPGEEV